MTIIASPPTPFDGMPTPARLPDHTQLPETDGSIVENFQEHPQLILLTTSILPVLRQLHPDGQFAIAQDSGIYYRYTDPPLEGCKSPDWYYIPNVSQMLDGKMRRSYVMWYEPTPPALLIEFASRDGKEERDRTPWKGKFWVYEHCIRPGFYAIFDVIPGRLEVFRHVETQFERVEANERGHFPIPSMGIELGIWHGKYASAEMDWLRFYDRDGNLLPIPEEIIEPERQRADQEHQRAERLAAILRELGVDPDAV